MQFIIPYWYYLVGRTTNRNPNSSYWKSTLLDFKTCLSFRANLRRCFRHLKSETSTPWQAGQTAIPHSLSASLAHHTLPIFLQKQKRKLFESVLLDWSQLEWMFLHRNSPSLIASTIVQSITVGILWATVITVQSANSVLIVFWRMESVALSMDAVASSSTSIRLLFSRARPKQNNCRWPMLQFDPSCTTVGETDC